MGSAYWLVWVRPLFLYMLWATVGSTGIGSKEAPAFNSRGKGNGPSHLEYPSRLSPTGEKLM